MLRSKEKGEKTLRNKLKIYVISLTLITLIVLLLPFSLSYLMKKQVFYFTSGAIDSWILFWGSYVGAIIGSIAALVIAHFEIKKQHEQQIQEIVNESEFMFQRDIEGYLLRYKIEKLDEMIQLATDLYYTIDRTGTLLYEKMERDLLVHEGMLEINETDRSEKDEQTFTTITTNTRKAELLVRKLQTLASYFPSMQDDLATIVEQLKQLDTAQSIILSDDESFQQFMQEDEAGIRLYVAPMHQLTNFIASFIAKKVKVELHNHLQAVKELSGYHLKIAKEPSK